MPSPYQMVEVILTQGLEQKVDSKSTTQGRLQDAQNVEFDKAGQLNKRRGYAAIDMTSDALGVTSEETFLNVAVFDDELVVFGYDYLYSLVSKDGGIATSKYIVRRGPVPRATVRRQDIATGGSSQPPGELG